MLSDGMSVSRLKPVSGGCGKDVRLDPETGLYYDLIRSSESDPVGVVVRTESDGDNPLRCTRVTVIQSTKRLSGKSAENCSAPVHKSVSRRKQNDQAIRAVLVTLSRDLDFWEICLKAGVSAYEIEDLAITPITPKIRKLVIGLIESERAKSGYSDEFILQRIEESE